MMIPNLTLDEAQAELPQWIVWVIGGVEGRPPTYSAKPVGMLTAIPECSGFYDLTALVLEAKQYELNIDLHIETVQQHLEMIDDYQGSREVQQSRYDALTALRAKLRAHLPLTGTDPAPG